MIARELHLAEERIEIAGEGIFTNVGTVQTSRNLATSEVMLTELDSRNQELEKRSATISMTWKNSGTKLIHWPVTAFPIHSFRYF